MLKSGIDQCNNCEAGKCKLCDAWRHSDRNIPAEPFEIKMMLEGTCVRRVKPQPFRRPLIEYAAYSNVQGVQQVLSAFNMKLVEYENRSGVVSTKVAKPKRKRRKGWKSRERTSTNRTTVRHKRSS